MKQRLLMCALAVLALGCVDPTQIVVFVDTPTGVPCDVDEIRVTVSGTATGMVPIPITTSTAFPVSVTVSASDGLGQARIETAAYKDGMPVLRSVTDAVFAENEILALTVPLNANCTTDAPCQIPGTVLPRLTTPPEPLTKRDCSVVVCVPTAETEMVCDGMDDDCNGIIDDGDVCPTVVRRYTVETDSFATFDDACGDAGIAPRQQLLMSVNGQEANVGETIVSLLAEEQFDFDFYGVPVRNIWVGDNGYVGFGATRPMSELLPIGAADANGVPRPGILAFWDNLETRADGVCVGLSGSGDNQRLHISWINACFDGCGPSDQVNVTVTLEESSNEILVAYDEMAAADPARALGSGATVAVVSADRECPAADCGTDGLCMSGAAAGMPCGLTQVFSGSAQSELRAYRFTPVEEE